MFGHLKIEKVKKRELPGRVDPEESSQCVDKLESGFCFSKLFEICYLVTSFFGCRFAFLITKYPFEFSQTIFDLRMFILFL